MILVADRVKTNNKSVMNNIATINDAMSRRLNGISHQPEKISFKYLKYSFDDMSQQVERRKGEKYIVSPYAKVNASGSAKLSVKEQMELLQQAKNMLDVGILTQDEFEQKKKEILNG